jgi:hypothetical protein
MANLFDSANYPQREPLALVIGDRWAWKRDDLGDYPAASYTLKYACRRESSGGDEIEITATANGTAFKVEVAAATTAAYTTGIYHWQAYITRNSDSERVTVDTGTFEIRANRDLATGDPRGHYKIVLDNIEAVIEKRATKDQESYSINGRSLTRTSLDDLVRLRDTYRAKYITELNRERARKGLGHRGRLLTRFK